MVLKNSKWDRNAKLRYLKKHGLVQRPPTNQTPTPKWSAKKASQEQSIGAWSEDDEEVLNQMFPQLGSPELTPDQRDKVKNQILADLIEEQQKQLEEQKLEHDRHFSEDGIYLGTKPEFDQPQAGPAPTTLEDFLSKDILVAKKTNRQLPSTAMRDNSVLEEYGIDNVIDTVPTGEKTPDYNDTYRSKQKGRSLAKILNDELVGFRVGVDTLGAKKDFQSTNTILEELNDEEKQQNKHMEQQANKAALYHTIKQRFGDKKSGKVLELNNLDMNDDKQAEWLEKRITKDTQNRDNLDDDRVLEEMLGISLNDNIEDKNDGISGTNGNIDDFNLEEIMTASKVVPERSKTNHIKKKAAPASQDFLDSLLN